MTEILTALLIGFLAIIALEILIPFFWGITKIILGVLIAIWSNGYGID